MRAENVTLKLSGWKVLVVIAIIIAALGMKIMTINDKIIDPKLIEEVRFKLKAEYLPADASNIKNLYDSGDMNKLAKAVQSVTTTNIHIDSIMLSYPIADFSFKDKNIVVKVIYSIDDAYGVRKAGVKYYYFKYSPMLNVWRYRGEGSALSYYLNFI